MEKVVNVGPERGKTLIGRNSHLSLPHRYTQYGLQPILIATDTDCIQIGRGELPDEVLGSGSKWTHRQSGR